MTDELRFDVYGQCRVSLQRGPDGWWVVSEIGTDGKRRRLTQVVVPPDAAPRDIPMYLEAVFREAARPGASISRIE